METILMLVALGLKIVMVYMGIRLNKDIDDPSLTMYEIFSKSFAVLSNAILILIFCLTIEFATENYVLGIMDLGLLVYVFYLIKTL